MVIEEKDLTEAALLSALAELQANREKYVQAMEKSGLGDGTANLLREIRAIASR